MASIIAESLGFNWLTYFIVVFSLCIYWLTWKNSRFVRLINKIPGPNGLPIIGNGWQLNVDQVEFLRIMHLKWFRQFGDIFRIWIGPRPVVVIAHPELMEPILNNQKLIEKATEYSYLKPWLGDCLFLTTGDRWKMRRRLLTPAFHFQILSTFFDVFNEQSRHLVEQFLKTMDTNDQQEIDIFPYVTQCALDIICETSMGRQVRKHEETASYIQCVHRMGQIVMERGVKPWLISDFIFSLTSLGRENQRCVDILHKFTTKVIKDRRQRLKEDMENGSEMGTNNNDAEKPKMKLAFLDLLIQASKDGHQLTDVEIREEVDLVMFAGHDTTASALTWFLYCIARHPEEQQMIIEEVDDIFGHSDRLCTPQDAAELKYLECCIKESLRLYPSIPAVMRNLTEDLQIGGYKLPAGTSVGLMIYAMHHNPKIYPDPEQFKPERFLPEQSAGRHPYAFIPFSAGPRNCIGQKYALFEVKVVLSTLFRKFRFSVREDLKTMELPSSEIVLKPVKDIPIIIQRRFPVS